MVIVVFVVVFQCPLGCNYIIKVVSLLVKALKCLQLAHGDIASLVWYAVREPGTPKSSFY